MKYLLPVVAALFTFHFSMAQDLTGILQEIESAISEKRIIGLGESTHGSATISNLKRAIILGSKRPVIFLEADFGAVMQLDEYIQGAEGDPIELIRNLEFYMYNSQEFLEMVNQLRVANENRPVASRIHLYGIDYQNPRHTAEWLLIHDPDTRCRDILLKLSKSYPGKDEAKEMIPELKKEITRPVPKLNLAYTVLFQCLESVGRSMISSGLFGNHDANLSKNVMTILETYPEAKGRKAVIWAHNSHIQKERSIVTGASMGSYLSKKAGNDYYAICFDFGNGQITAGGPLGLGAYDVSYVPENKAFKELFNIRETVAFIPSDSKIYNFKEASIHEIGGLYDPSFQNNCFVKKDLTNTFNAIVFCKTSLPLMPAYNLTGTGIKFYLELPPSMNGSTILFTANAAGAENNSSYLFINADDGYANSNIRHRVTKAIKGPDAPYKLTYLIPKNAVKTKVGLMYYPTANVAISEIVITSIIRGDSITVFSKGKHTLSEWKTEKIRNDLNIKSSNREAVFSTH